MFKLKGQFLILSYVLGTVQLRDNVAKSFNFIAIIKVYIGIINVYQVHIKHAHFSRFLAPRNKNKSHQDHRIQVYRQIYSHMVFDHKPCIDST